MHFQNALRYLLRLIFFIRTQLNAKRLLAVLDGPWTGSARVLSHPVAEGLLGECGGDVNTFIKHMSYLGWVCLQTMTFMNTSGYL